MPARPRWHAAPTSLASGASGRRAPQHPLGRLDSPGDADRAHIAASTRRIRVGSGGVMLPNHAPLAVAERFGMLEALHPNRIDLGLAAARYPPSARSRNGPSVAENTVVMCVLSWCTSAPPMTEKQRLASQKRSVRSMTLTREPRPAAARYWIAGPPTPPGQPNQPVQPNQPTPGRTLSWAPRPAETAVTLAAGLVMAGLGFTVDPTGRWLVWAAAALLFGIAAVDLLLRPRLRADGAGLTVRSMSGGRSASWSQIEMSLRSDQRFGRSVPSLELDIEDDLIIFGRRELGADPTQVLQQLTELRTAP